MSYKIENHDYQVRLKNARKFVTQGNRVSPSRREADRRRTAGREGMGEGESAGDWGKCRRE